MAFPFQVLKSSVIIAGRVDCSNDLRGGASYLQESPIDFGDLEILI